MNEQIREQMHALYALLETGYHSGETETRAAVLDASYFLASAIFERMETEGGVES